MRETQSPCATNSQASLSTCKLVAYKCKSIADWCTIQYIQMVGMLGASPSKLMQFITTLVSNCTILKTRLVEHLAARIDQSRHLMMYEDQGINQLVQSRSYMECSVIGIVCYVLLCNNYCLNIHFCTTHA